MNYYYSQFNYFNNLSVDEEEIPADIQELIDEEFNDEEE